MTSSPQDGLLVHLKATGQPFKTDPLRSKDIIVDSSATTVLATRTVTPDGRPLEGVGIWAGPWRGPRIVLTREAAGILSDQLVDLLDDLDALEAGTNTSATHPVRPIIPIPSDPSEKAAAS